MIFKPLVLGLALSADSFSAALAMGLRKHHNKDAFIFALFSGGAEAMAALLGAFLGKTLVFKYGDYGQWTAFTMLMLVSLHLIKDGVQELRSCETTIEDQGFHRFHKILIVSFATSFDALGVGVGLGAIKEPLAPYIISIGLFAFVGTLLGLYLARRTPKRLGPYSNFLGALILGILAIKMLDI